MLSQEKIVVVIPHNACNVKLAEHYGYSEILQTFLQRKKEEGERFNKAVSQDFAQSAEERREAQEKLETTLLS